MTEFKVKKGYQIDIGLDQMQNFAADFLTFIYTEFGTHLNERAVLVSLSGDLGAGKTTFSQKVAEKLKIKEHVTSPTFVIQKIYKTEDSLISQFVHIDAYRLEDSTELSTLNFDLLLKQPNTLVFMEWPEKVPVYGDLADIRITFTVKNETERHISVA